MNWRVAEVVNVVPETPGAKTIAFDVPPVTNNPYHVVISAAG